MTLLQEMLSHGLDESPNECCGLVVASGRRTRVIRAKNISPRPRQEFDLDPEAWLEVGDDEEVVGIYHSHPHGNATPSEADRAACENSKLPWHIVNPHTEEYQLMNPCGYVAPYEGRPYLFGVLDCYSIVRDWYRSEMGLELMDFVRERDFWKKDIDLFGDNFRLCGFKDIEMQEPQRGDLFLLQQGWSVPNHIFVYIGDDKILHHVQDRLSKIDPFGGYWKRYSTHQLRHASLMGNSNG